MQKLFSDGDCKHKNGYIQVMTNKPFYEPGERVEGNIYIRVTVPINGIKGLEFEVKGGGKNSFIRYWIESHTEGEGENRKTVFEERSEKLKNSKKFLGDKEMMNVLGSSLAVGDY